MHLAPVNVFEELLDETVLLRPSPDDLFLKGLWRRITENTSARLPYSCIGVIEQKSNADNSYVFHLVSIITVSFRDGDRGTWREG